MSYLVMARRWRPQRFADVVGQEHVTRTLRMAIARGRVAHAYLFTGPRGVGKTTTARLLAMAVNDTEPITGPDGLPDLNPDTEQNREIATGNALDVIEIDGASNNKVDDVRQLRETIKYAPSQLAKKVYIIDEVHMLSQAAFNALLKTLEEPPEHAMFIFATTEAHKVPATVLSRCQRYDFKRISTTEIRSQLQRIVDADELDVSGDALTAIAVKADGALRDALSILDQLVAYQGGEAITEDVVRQALGLIGGEIYFRTTDLAATGEVSAALTVARDLTAGGHDAREFLRGLQRHVLRYLYLKAGGGADELAVTEEERDRYASTLDQFADEDLLRIGEWAAESEDVLRDALDPVLRLELLLVRIAKMDRAVDLGALLQRMGVDPDSFGQERKRPGDQTATPSPSNRTGVGSGSADSPPPMSSTTARARAGSDSADLTPDAPSAQPSKTPLDKPTGASPASNPATPSGAPGSTPGSSAADEAVGGAPPTGTRGSQPAGAHPGPQAAAMDQDADVAVLEPPPAPVVTTSPSAPEAQADDESNGEDDTDDPPAVDESGLTLELIREGWPSFCDKVDEVKTLLGSHLLNGMPSSLEDGALELVFDKSCVFFKDAAMRNRDEIGRLFARHFGHGVRLMIRTDSLPASQRPQPQQARGGPRQKRAFDEVLAQRPVWKEMVERFQLG